jgi:hypothetical protein
MLVDSADKLKLMTVLDFPSNNISDESIGRPCTVKKEEKISSYIWKFRRDRVQSLL